MPFVVLLVAILLSPYRSAAVDLAPGDLVAVDEYHDRVFLIDSSTGARSDIAVVEDPLSVLVEPAGTLLVGRAPQVPYAGTLIRLDPSDGSTSDPLGGRYTSEVSGMAFDALGRVVLVSPSLSGLHTLVQVDLSNLGVVVLTDLSGFSLPTAVAVEPSGSILVVDQAASGAVVRVDPSNGHLETLSAGGLIEWPSDIVVTAAGEIFVTSTDLLAGDGRIVRIDTVSGVQSLVVEGEYLSDVSSLAQASDGSLLAQSLFNGPGNLSKLVRIDPLSGVQSVLPDGTGAPWASDIDVVRVSPVPTVSTPVFLSRGDIVAANPFDQVVVHVDGETGARSILARVPDTDGSLPPQDESVRSVLVEPAGTILVGLPERRRSSTSSSLVRLNPKDGSHYDPAPGLFRDEVTRMIFDHSGRLIVASDESGVITRVDLQQGSAETLAQGGIIVRPRGLALESSGDILIINATQVGSIVRLNPDTGAQSTLSSGGLLTFPSDVAVSDTGSIYCTTASDPDGLAAGRVLRVDPETGDQEIVAMGGLLHELAALEIKRDGTLLVSSGGDSVSFHQDRLVRLDLISGTQTSPSVGWYGVAPILQDIEVFDRFVCPPAPVPECVAAGKSSIRMKAAVSGRDPKLVWKWVRGTVRLSDLGDPRVDVEHVLCGYVDGANILEAPIGAGGVCSKRDCWKELGTSGFAYRDRAGNLDGVTNAKLVAGDGRAKVLVKAGRERLRLPSQPVAGASMRIQLLSSRDRCWESTFGGFRRNDERILKAVSVN